MAEATGEGGDDTARDAARAKRRQRFRLFAASLAIAALGGVLHWFLTRNDESTDDAFVDANVVQVAPQVGGLVTAVHFTDNQRVAAGAALVDIDPRDYQAELDAATAGADVAKAQQQAARADLDLTRATTGAAVDEARNGVEQARHEVEVARHQADAGAADATRAEADAKRYADLVREADASRQRQEQALADARSSLSRWRAQQLAAEAAQAAQAQAEARLRDALAAPQRLALKEAQLANAVAQQEQAEAALETARLTLSYTRLTAPQDGRMGRRAVNVGDVLQRSQVVALLVTDPPWITANFKENQLARMRPGQPAEIRIDAFPGHSFRGHVDSVQPGSGARFSLLPPENATGNYIKVVQRIPVKIVFDDPADPLLRQLSPGMSAVPVVDVGQPGASNP